MKFELTPKEQKRYEKWKKELPSLHENYFGAAGGGYFFKFIPTGIGTIVIVGREDCPEYDKDITDFESW